MEVLNDVVNHDAVVTATELVKLADEVRNDDKKVREKALQFFTLLDDMLGGLDFTVDLWKTNWTDYDNFKITQFVRLTGQYFRSLAHNGKKVYIYEYMQHPYEEYSRINLIDREKQIMDYADISYVRKLVTAVMENLPNILKQLKTTKHKIDDLSQQIDKAIQTIQAS